MEDTKEKLKKAIEDAQKEGVLNVHLDANDDERMIKAIEYATKWTKENAASLVQRFEDDEKI